MSICLLPTQVESFKQALKNKDINLADLLNLDHADLVEKLKPYAGASAESVATMLEAKLILKNRTLGLTNALAKMTESGKYSPAKIAEHKAIVSDFRAKQQERIFSPTEHQSYLGGIVEKQLGFSVSRDVAGKIGGLVNEVNNLKESAVKQPLGTSAELINKQKELSDFINSQNTKPAWASIRDSVANMYKNLFIGVKTGVKTFTLGLLNSVIEAPIRRISSGVPLGAVEMSAKLNAIIEVAKMFKETGVNTIISVSPDDNVFGESKGGIAEQFGRNDVVRGKGIVPTVARAVNKISQGVRYVAIDILHKVPMVATSVINFADALDITSTQLAKMDAAKGASATEIFNDALKIEPETDMGKIARARAQQDTFRVLNINNSPLAEATVKLQRAINERIPTLGNYLLPMAKVPSNVIYNQLENFGGGLGTGTMDILKGMEKFKELKDVGQEHTSAGTEAVMQIRDGTKTLVRTIGVVGTAYLITQNLQKRDFYSDTYGNSYVKLGNYWLNTDAFGAVGTAVAGTMLGKIGSKGYLFDYGIAGFNALSRAPVVDGISSMVQQGKKGKLTSNLVSSFIHPIMLNDIQKSIDEKTPNPFFFGSLIRTEEQVKQEDAARAKAKALKKRGG